MNTINFILLAVVANLNNYRGLLNNIKGVKLYEEGSYTSPKVNVWGISDKDLFKESNTILKQQQKPFFCYHSNCR
jgi:phosphoglycerol transferase MdoB-like AlkP superfamily enzyme